MRQMISKAALVAVCLGLISSGAMAAAGAKAADRGAMMATRAVEPFRTALSKVTNLTDDEKTKTDAILNDATAEVQAIVDDSKADAKDAKATPGATKGAGAKGDRRQKLMDLNDKTRDKILAVLTDEQKPEFKKALVEARSEARGNRGAAGGAGAGRRAGSTTKPAA